MRPRPILALLVLPSLVVATPAIAVWPHDPYNGNVPVSAIVGTQSELVTVSDGAGGALLAWSDTRSGGQDIYVQRVSASGSVLWTVNGVAACTAGGIQSAPAIVGDGSGGAIVAWQDFRGANYDIYVQRVNASGAVQWTANGVALCTAVNLQGTPDIVSDGAGGAIVVWQDVRGATGYDIYARRVSAAGAPLWAADGVALCTAANGQNYPRAVTDGSGGAFVVWEDVRSGSQIDIYARRIDGAGNPQWIANGEDVCTDLASQDEPVLVADGLGGIIVAWEDSRGADDDIYVQRLNGSGATQWSSNGLPLASTTGDQSNPEMVTDGAGGAIVTWYDDRGTSLDVYVQRTTAGGAFLWTANGVALTTSTGNQWFPTIVADGSGGAIVGWRDSRFGDDDIFAQRISSTGAVQWTSGGVAVCAAAALQSSVRLAPDGNGGAILAWQDSRNGNSDLYAQRVERYGQLGNPEAVVSGVKDVTGDQGGYVKVSWSASYLDADPVYGVSEYRLWRSVPAATASGLARARATTSDPDQAAASGALLVGPFAASVYAWELVGNQVASTLPSYSLVAATTRDSVAGSNPRTAFMVEARVSASVSSDRWFSQPDSGYSVDNLAPATPAPFTGYYDDGATRLAWKPNAEADLAGYRLYRGNSVGFTPSPSNLVSAQPDTGYVDPAGAPYIYKLTAVDVHGNESPVATLVPNGALAVGDDPAALAFAPPMPNPARGSTTLRFTLSRAGHARLVLHDAAGRLVRVVQDGLLDAGEHAAAIDPSDDNGKALTPGLYLARLEVDGRSLVRRFTVVR